MNRFVSLSRVHGVAVAAAVLVFGFVAETGAYAQRRGRGVYIPPRPVNVDSSPTIGKLNKALAALAQTDQTYDGRREKAINHIAAAIRHLEMPNAKGKSNAAVDKALTARPAGAGTTSPTASEASVRKALAALFAAHHELKDHTATRGHIRADADVRIAIDELSRALHPPRAATSTAAPAAPAARTGTAGR